MFLILLNIYGIKQFIIININTILLFRNFIMNPQSGLRIRAFRDAHTNRAKDRELLKLSKYLELIAKVEDFQTLNHKKWEEFSHKSKKSRQERHDISDDH